MIRIIDDIPHSLYKKLSDGLLIIIKENLKNDTHTRAIPRDLASRIIHLWQLDHLASEIGIQLLAEAALMVDAISTYHLFEELGLLGIIKLNTSTHMSSRFNEY